MDSSNTLNRYFFICIFLGYVIYVVVGTPKTQVVAGTIIIIESVCGTIGSFVSSIESFNHFYVIIFLFVERSHVTKRKMVVVSHLFSFYKNLGRGTVHVSRSSPYLELSISRQAFFMLHNRLLICIYLTYRVLSLIPYLRYMQVPYLLIRYFQF